MKITKSLQLLIKIARLVGLNEQDIKSAEELLNHREYGLSFDTLITQIFEYNIEISNEIYELIIYIGHKLKLPEKNYLYMEELVGGSQELPHHLKLEIAKIIG